MAGYNDYQVTTCSITDEECWRGDCSICEIAKEHEQDEKDQHHRDILDFSSNKYELYGVKVLAGNKTNTMAIVYMAEYEQMQANGLTGVEYTFGQYVESQYPHFTCLMQKMDLPCPPHTIKADNQLGVFMYDDYVYFCAGRNESGVD